MTEMRETCQAVVDIAISEEIVRLRERCAELEAANKPKFTREETKNALDVASWYLTRASRHGQFEQWMSYLLEALESDDGLLLLFDTKDLLDDRLFKGKW